MISLRSCGFVAVLALCLSVRPAPTEEKKPSELVTRDRIQLNLAGAEMIVAEAKKKAEELKLKVNIAVVDDGGHLLSFARMDGARPASGYTAITKAVTAAKFRQETGPLPPKGEPDVLWSLSLQEAAAERWASVAGPPSRTLTWPGPASRRCWTPSRSERQPCRGEPWCRSPPRSTSRGKPSN